MKRYYKITTNTPDETNVNELSEPWLLLDKSETGKDNFIFQRSINNLTLDLCEGYGIDVVEDFVNRDEEHALTYIQNTDNTYTVIYKKEKTELSSDSIYQSCKNIILPNSITKINPEMFKDFSNLENITLPNSISEIGDGAFYGCLNLTIIKVPSRVTRINSNLFNSCTNLTKAYIPNNIHYISKIAFNKCENLTEIILYNELTNSEKHFYVNENGEISIDYYDENGELKNIIIDINRSGNKEWELHELTPANNVILYKTHSGNMYDFDDGVNTSYVEGYTINDDGTHSPSTELKMIEHGEANNFDGYRIAFDENTNISKIIGNISGNKQWFYFESTDLTEIYLPVSVTDINNCVFNTPNLSTLLLPPNISLTQHKLPDNTDESIYDLYVETLHNCGKLKNILYNGTSEEFNKIISNSDTSDTWYKDLPYKFTVTCLDKVLNFVNNYTNEILYKAPLVANRDYTIKRVSTSIYITTSELTPTNDDYNILQFDYTSSDNKKLNGYYEASNGGHEFYCLQSDAITELVLPNGVEEIDALAFNCPNLTTITLPNSIKRFKTVRYTDVWSADLETVNRTLIFGSNIETIYFNGTEYEWNAIDKNLNWNPEGKKVKVICRDKEFVIESIDDIPYQMVDLGLPSGLIWADRNIGAETPQDNGLYFSWGNIEGHAADENGKTMYGYSFDKNTYNETLGSQYTGSELATEYDAATANMGGEWHMPTIEDISELVENTNHYYIDDDGNTIKKSELSSSRKLRSICFVKKGVNFNYNNRSNFIEFPFAGYCSGSLLFNDGFYGYILSSSIFDTKSACTLNTLNTGHIDYNEGLNRYLGSPVRGVRGPLEYKMVDLGLPSGIKWADRNVGAETPQDNGLYFSWGNVDGHRADENGNTIDGYSFDNVTYYTTTLGSQYTDSELDIEHDAAAVNMGGNWRMPTIEEISELAKNTVHYYIGKDGSIVAGPFNYEASKDDKGLDGHKLRSICFVKKDTIFDYNVRDNFIEFPFAGYFSNFAGTSGSSLLNEGVHNDIWSSSIYKNNPREFAYDLNNTCDGYMWCDYASERYCGCSVRGVYAPIEYNMVDLGLSVKWADRNVGAKTPRDKGLYFSWGNVDGHAVGKSGNTIDGYSFDSDTYATTSGSQYTGSTLDAEHDAATVNMDGNWRMPTMDEIVELIESTDKRYIDEYGNILNKSQLDGSIKLRSICFVKQGEKFDYNDRSNFIEFPFTGRCYEGSLLKSNGLYGCIWTNSGDEINKEIASYLKFNNDGSIDSESYRYRCHGLSVRGVCAHETFDYQEIIAKQNTIIEKLNQQNQSLQETVDTLNLKNQQLTDQIATVESKTITENGIYYPEEGKLGWNKITINVPTNETPEENESGYQMIDLGLPSGRKWADRNVGAETPQDNGLYFSWGNVDGHAVDETGKTVDGYLFDPDTYSETHGNQYNGSELDAEHDAATVNMGSNWRMPTCDEISELVYNTEQYYIDEDGNILNKSELDGSSKLHSICFVKIGEQFNYNNRSNFIEIPFAGYCNDSLLEYDGTYIYIWSNSVCNNPILPGVNKYAYHLFLSNNSGISINSGTMCYYGISVRAVYVDETYECPDCSGYLERIKSLEDENKQLEDEKQQLEDDIDVKDRTIGSLETENQRLVAENTNLTNEVTDKTTQIGYLNGQITQKDTTIATLNTDNQRLETENTKLNEQINSVTSETFTTTGTFSAPEGVLGWDQITINIPATGGGTNTGGTTSTITKIEVADETTDLTEITHDNNTYYIQGPDRIRIEGTNLVVNNNFNFTFSGDSTSDEIKDPNFNICWISLKKTKTVCELQCEAGEKDGITLTPPYVNPKTSN